MDAARERVVRDDHVAGAEVLRAVVADRARRLLDHRAEVHRLREALRHGAELASKKAHEKSARVLMFVEYALLRSASTISSVAATSALRITSNVTRRSRADLRRSATSVVVLPVGEVGRVLRGSRSPGRPSRRRPPCGARRRRPAGSSSRTSTAAPPRCRRRRMSEVRGERTRLRRPARPYGGCAARSERTISDVSGVRQRQTRSIARPPRCSPGAAAVGDEPVALDHDRELGLGDLDRDVRGEARRVRQSPSLPSSSGVPPHVPTTSS